MSDNKKLAEILNGKNFLKFLEDEDYKNVDVNDLALLIGIAAECEGKNFKFSKTGEVRCLRKIIYDQASFFFELKRYMVANYNKLNKEGFNKLLEWDRFVLLGPAYEDRWYRRSAFILMDDFFKNNEAGYRRTVMGLADKYFNDIKRVFFEILEKWVKNPPYDIIVKFTEYTKVSFPFIHIINYFLCKNDPDVTKFIVDNIKVLAKPYIMNGKRFGALAMKYECLLKSIYKNGIELDELLLLTLLNFILTESISDCELISPILDRICSDYNYENYWDEIKNYLNDCIKPNYYCFEVMDIFEI
jgi:hypothetical protein